MVTKILCFHVDKRLVMNIKVGDDFLWFNDNIHSIFVFACKERDDICMFNRDYDVMFFCLPNDKILTTYGLGWFHWLVPQL